MKIILGSFGRFWQFWAVLGSALHITLDIMPDPEREVNTNNKKLPRTDAMIMEYIDYILILSEYSTDENNKKKSKIL